MTVKQLPDHVCSYAIQPFKLTLVLLIVFIAVSCGSKSVERNLTNGVWSGKGGPDEICFDLWIGDGDELTGAAHTVREGKQQTQCPMTRVEWNPPLIEMEMSTGVVYKGTVRMNEGRIEGGLFFRGEPTLDMELQWKDPQSIAGLRARPEPKPGAPTYTASRPEECNDGWKTANPEDVGLDSAAINDLVTSLVGGEAGEIHSLLIAKDGKLVVEEYFHGYGRNDTHRLASVTKSVSSLLVGLALELGKIESVDTPLLDFFPQHADLRTQSWDRITLRHLLTMSMGLDWTDEEGRQIHGAGEEFFKQVFSRKVSGTPGAKWRYINPDVNLLGGVLKHSTQMHADLFAAKHIFAPLGIEAWSWDYGEVDGYRLMDGSLQLRPRDMAKIGALVADEGRWCDRQVISADWIRESTLSQIPTGEQADGYGYLWWLFRLPAGGDMQTMVLANGWGSQFIAVFPALNMVVVTTGCNEDNGKHFAVGQLLSQYLLARL